MKYEDIIVSFQDFEPAPAIRNFVGKITEEVMNEAPSIACLKASFKNSGNRILGQFEICSPAGMFLATSVGNNMQAVVKRLAERMKRQLDSWKLNRFQEESNETSTPRSFVSTDEGELENGLPMKDSNAAEVALPQALGGPLDLSIAMAANTSI
jgi:hypothetical protein